MTGLSPISRAEKALEQAETIGEVKDLYDLAEAYRTYASSAEEQNRAAAFKLRAAAKGGRLLRERPRRPGPGRGRTDKRLDKLSGLFPGLSDSAAAQVAQRWRTVSHLDDAGVLDRYFASEPDEITMSGALDLWKQTNANSTRQADQAAREIDLAAVSFDAEGERWRLMAGDFRDRLADLPHGSVDLIVTDPPYATEFLPLYEDLSRLARDVLTDDGLCAVLVGKINLSAVIDALETHLIYGWCYVQPLPGANARIMARHVVQAWKPWFVFSLGTWPSNRIDWHPDVLDPSVRMKDQYRWQQDPHPARMLISDLCPDEGTVCDPFAGTGAYGRAALSVGRRFIGVELDRDRFDLARKELER